MKRVTTESALDTAMGREGQRQKVLQEETEAHKRKVKEEVEDHVLRIEEEEVAYQQQREVHQQIQENLFGQHLSRMQALKEEYEQRISRVNAVMEEYEQKMEEHRQNMRRLECEHQNRMLPLKGLLLSCIEMVCYREHASFVCEVNAEGDIADRVVDPEKSGLTFEDLGQEPDAAFASRFASKQTEIFIPSTSSPSKRLGKDYKGNDKVQVASHNGAMWWDATVIAWLPRKQLLAVCFVDALHERPRNVSPTSVRLKDWFRLHEKCRRAVLCWLWWQNQTRTLVKDLRELIAKNLWETRDDRMWE
jgi:hypothetical protein